MDKMENATFYPTVLLNETNVTLNDSFKNAAVPILRKYYPILAAELGLSIFCSVILIVAYIIIGEQRTLPGKNVICISLCLIVTYVLLMIDLLMRDTIPQSVCMTMGIVVQTTFLATFFWTNVMSYDIMKTMASVKPDSEHKSKFWKYSIYAWAMTFLSVLPAIVVDQIEDVPDMYKPKFGQKKCWMTGQLAFLIYLNAPVGLTLIANCVFFVVTARTIIKVRSATAILAANRHKKRFRLCMKLVLIMGLVWIAEFIPWITGIYWLYTIAGMLNCMHGVYLFLIFVCKKRILKQVASSLCTCPASLPTPEAKKVHSPSLETVTTTIQSQEF